MRIYLLKMPFDNPRNYGFSFAKSVSSLIGNVRIADDFMPIDFPNSEYPLRIASLEREWRPSLVEGNLRPFIDFSMIGTAIPIFRRHAAHVLSDLLKPNGELLPVGDSFFAYNCRTVIDLLDIEASELVYSSETERYPARIEKYSPKLDDTPAIFRLLHQPQSIFVSDEFFDRCQAAALNGFLFVRLWPLKEGCSWRDEDRESTEQAMLINGRPVDAVKCELAIDGLDEAEVESLVDDMESRLFEMDVAPDGPFVGSIDDVYCEANSSEITLFGPEEDSLREWLKSFLVQCAPHVTYKVTFPSDGEGIPQAIACTEESIDRDLRLNIERGARVAKDKLQLTASESSVEIFQAIEDEVVGRRNRVGSLGERLSDSPGFLLGCLWGQQLIHEFGWVWVKVRVELLNAESRIAVVSPNRALAIFPHEFIESCLAGRAAATIVLSFNLLSDPDEIPALPAHGYEDVMLHLHHIVPKD